MSSFFKLGNGRFCNHGLKIRNESVSQNHLKEYGAKITHYQNIYTDSHNIMRLTFIKVSHINAELHFKIIKAIQPCCRYFLIWII